MSKFFRCSGIVLNGNYSPVSDAQVSVISGSLETPEISSITDEGGKFVIALPEGDFVLIAMAPEGQGKSHVTVSSDKAPEIIITITRS